MRTLPFLLLSAMPFIVQAQLSGTYSVGGSSPDFATPAAAFNALMGQGANGTVNLHIRPGTYTGQYSFGSIPGSPGIINIMKEPGTSGSVIFEYDASGTNDNFIVQIDGTDQLVFSTITFRPLDLDYGRAIHFFNEIQDLQFTQCTFEGSTNPNGSGYFQRYLVQCDQSVLPAANNPQDVVISECSFINGSTAIALSFRAFQGARSQGLIIAENEFIDQFGTGVDINAAVGEVRDNLFMAHDVPYYVGVRTAYFDNGSRVLRNRVDASTTGDVTGIEFSNTQSTMDNLVADNMVHVASPTASWGLVVYNLWGTTVAHNSVLVAEGDAGTSNAFYHLSNFPDGQDALVRNNIFANNTGGASYFVEVPGNVAVEDHNDLFTTGAILSQVGTSTFPTLVDHQNGTGMGTDDIDTDPVFPAQPDLHMNNCAMDNAGMYLSEVDIDIDGDPRGNPACDMGADEYTASTNAVQAPTVTILSSELPYDLGLNANFNSYNWNTGSTAPTTTITQAGNYSCQVTDVNGCSYPVNVTVVVEISTGLGETLAAPGLDTYPNPAVDVVHIRDVADGTSYAVLTTDGRMALSGATQDGRLDVSGLPPGVYLLRIGRQNASVARFQVVR
ncbi:MAG: T9SS type A sorting domain-containing protein [Flavobacteriales bacterium]|nr:T9SS type A sorting domain-containing protein [Flavobacteriales bacterium]MCB9167528.1 T9SS type A sorting domain-containing protein [Flavobacteriales bacterium]